jgi:GR25 family glycosyltransferase involved in LPS biosynthesis
MDSIDVIYWINLDRSGDRRERMRQFFKDPIFRGKKIVRFPAIDGKRENLSRLLKMPANKTLNEYEYACLLSHLEVLRILSLQPQYKRALILEDDATLDYKPFWKKSVDEVIDKAPGDWEALMLTYISHQVPTEDYTLNKDQYWSTLAYVVTSDAARRLVELTRESDGLYHLDETIPSDADRYIFLKLRTYVYKYPFFVYQYNEQSTIRQVSVPIHDASRQKIDAMYGIERDGKKAQAPSRSSLVSCCLCMITVGLATWAVSSYCRYARPRRKV